MLLVPDGALRPSATRILQASRTASSDGISGVLTVVIFLSSPSMYGTVLDQRVFERLVQRCLPSIHDHFAEADVQLSVASLPWFLSLYISSLPMVFAFRIIDCFFLMGPKVLFQVG
jgi:hypothetical protein